jgi:hypothetical protein
MNLILFRRRTVNDQWSEAPIECMTDHQESGWLYRYFLV